MKDNAWTLTIATLLVAACTRGAPEESVVDTGDGGADGGNATVVNDDFEQAVRGRQTSIQIEVNDFDTRFGAGINQAPAIRIGVDLQNIQFALPGEPKPRQEVVLVALRSGVGLVRVATRQLVDLMTFDQSSYLVHSVEGAELRDALGPPRLERGIGVVPGPLAEGWYIAYIDLTNALRAGMQMPSAQRHFVNEQRGNVLFARFYVGSQSVWRRTSVVCGAAADFGDKSFPWPRACLFAPQFTSSPKSTSLSVTYDNVRPDCQVPVRSPNGRQRRGLLCPEPAPDAMVTVSFAGIGAVDPTLKPPAPMLLAYRPGDAKLFVPRPANPNLVTATLAPHEAFGLDLLP